MKKLYKDTKKAYTRRYRVKHADKVAKYNKEHSADTVSRIQARREMVKKMGKGALRHKEIHHSNGNPKDNSKGNLKVAKFGHGGGAGKGNKNASGPHKKKR